MKTVVHNANAKDKLLHIEAEGCIINIRVGLKDVRGNNVTSIEIHSDHNAGEPAWMIDNLPGASVSFRVVQEDSKESEDRRTWENAITEYGAVRLSTLVNLHHLKDYALNKFVVLRDDADRKVDVNLLYQAHLNGCFVFDVPADQRFGVVTLTENATIGEAINRLRQLSYMKGYRFDSWGFGVSICTKCLGEGEYDCPECERTSRDGRDPSCRVFGCIDAKIGCEECMGLGIIEKESE